MNVFALCLWIPAAFCFAAAHWYPRLTNLGLCLLTVGLIVQSGSTTHNVTF